MGEDGGLPTILNVPEPRLVAGVAVREWGGRGGKPVLFWHALGDHNNLQLVEVGPVLASEYGLWIVAIDAPGFGASPPAADPAYQVPALVELAVRVLDELGLERVVWMGASWGGSLGVHFCVAHPERVEALVLLDGGYRDPGSDAGPTLEEQRAHWRAHPELFRYESWDALVEDARSFFKRWTPGVETSVRSAYREQDGEVVSIMGPGVYAAASAGILAAPPSTAHERLGRTGIPVLVLAATLPEENHPDRIAAAERFSKLVPQAEIRWLEGAPHFVLEAKPDEVARAVGEWTAAPYA